MAGTLTLEDSAFGCWKDYPLPWLCSSVVAGEYDLVSSLWICNDLLKHKIGAKMLLELKNLCVILCDAREFLCPWCRRWCTSRGFLGWLSRGVESCRVFHVLYFVWCSFFFSFFLLQPISDSWEVTAKGMLSAEHSTLAPAVSWQEMWRKSGILHESDRWFGSLSGKCGAEEQKWHLTAATEDA